MDDMAPTVVGGGCWHVSRHAAQSGMPSQPGHGPSPFVGRAATKMVPERTGGPADAGPMLLMATVRATTTTPTLRIR